MAEHTTVKLAKALGEIPGVPQDFIQRAKASILTAYDDDGELSALIDRLSRRAGITPAAATAGTGHLAAQLRDRAIPDEEG
jgi:hypothetical protein